MGLSLPGKWSIGCRRQRPQNFLAPICHVCLTTKMTAKSSRDNAGDDLCAPRPHDDPPLTPTQPSFHSAIHQLPSCDHPGRAPGRHRARSGNRRPVRPRWWQRSRPLGSVHDTYGRQSLLRLRFRCLLEHYSQSNESILVVGEIVSAPCFLCAVGFGRLPFYE